MPVDISEKSVTITHPATSSSATIHLFGATVTSWKCQGQEKLFVSTQAVYDGSKPIRGGIPLVFPKFGLTPGSKMPQHGFGRNSTWKWLGTVTDNSQETTVSFGLSPANANPTLYPHWPNQFELVYNVTLTANTLKTTLKAKNTGETTFDITPLFHTYFAVSDISKVGVSGLKGVTFSDKVDSSMSGVETRELVTVAGEVDRVYEDVKINHFEIIENAKVGLKVDYEGFSDVVVWNPWIEKAKGMADFNDSGYQNMICVEVGRVTKPAVLGPSETWEGTQICTAV
ncbi:hypothetical protein HDV05_005290 [Chytridiales sp. JEL 0842]|nr:hypothetical protein HDV05_005290 [Chytridiales sp. JEL 0842]